MEASSDLAAETLRDHLKALAAKGLVERAGLRREGPGRPFVLYRLTDAAAELFPQREGELLRELATFLVDSGRDDVLADFFAARAEGRKARLHERLVGLGESERLEEVARILSEEGFLAEVQVSQRGPSLRLCHCPLRELVAVSHLPCQAEMNLVNDLLGRTLRRESFMPDGDSCCTYSIGETDDPSDALEVSNLASH
ncbi:MAG: transcriptional regulator [Thermoanaerobaculia bacterium]|nr:transcriptional regulator [Thermoanaerobaculia bacterium]